VSEGLAQGHYTAIIIAKRSNPKSALFTGLMVCACYQWRRHTRECQGECPGINTSDLAAALAVKSVNDKITYQDI